MKDSVFWRVMGVGAVLGLLWIGYGLGKSSQFSPPSFSSAAYAAEVPPAKPVAKGPKLNFTEIQAHSANSAELLFERAKVDGGWILMVTRRVNGNYQVEGFTFYPDPKHRWTGESEPSKAEIDELREESQMRKEAHDKAPPRIMSPAFNPAAAAAKALELYDADKDGKISGKELDKAPGLKAALKVMKSDKDKGVTADQISARLKAWLDSKVGRTSLSCMVMHNGKPLSGATVKYIPEKFLSDALTETATGVTNQTGMAMISLPTGSGPDALPPGVAPGIYRVEITKDGEKIPAKYNTETVLGQEVSLDNIELQMGIKYDLKY